MCVFSRPQMSFIKHLQTLNIFDQEVHKLKDRIWCWLCATAKIEKILFEVEIKMLFIKWIKGHFQIYIFVLNQNPPTRCCEKFKKSNAFYLNFGKREHLFTYCILSIYSGRDASKPHFQHSSTIHDQDHFSLCRIQCIRALLFRWNVWAQ